MNYSNQKQNPYNDEPVFYCTLCLSLKIRHAGVEDTEYCDNCGHTNIATAPIWEWQEMYKERYGHYYLEEF